MEGTDTRTLVADLDTGKITDSATGKIMDLDTGELFDRNAHTDPRLELRDERGNNIDHVELTFTGKIDLRRSDPASMQYVRDVVLSNLTAEPFELRGFWVERKVRLTPEKADGTGGERILTLKATIDSIAIPPAE